MGAIMKISSVINCLLLIFLLVIISAYMKSYITGSYTQAVKTQDCILKDGKCVNVTEFSR